MYIQIEEVQYVHVVYSSAVPGGQITGCHQMQNGAKLGSLESPKDIIKGLATVTFIFRRACLKQVGRLKRHVKARASLPPRLLRAATPLIQIISAVKLISKYHRTFCDTIKAGERSFHGPLLLFCLPVSPPQMHPPALLFSEASSSYNQILTKAPLNPGPWQSHVAPIFRK